MRAGLKDALIGAIIGGLITGIPAYVGLGLQGRDIDNQKLEIDNRTKELQNQAEELQNQAGQLQELQKQTEIMRQSVEKKSFVLMFATPHTGGNNEEATSFVISGGPNGTANVVDVNTAQQTRILRLHENETVTVEIVLANVGSSVAYLNSWHLTIVPTLDSNVTTFIVPLQARMDKVLPPDSKTYSFPIQFLVTQDFAPRGKIYLEVLHDSGVQKVVLDYEYVQSAGF